MRVQYACDDVASTIHEPLPLEYANTERNSVPDDGPSTICTKHAAPQGQHTATHSHVNYHVYYNHNY
jgi:hypothetical protein